MPVPETQIYNEVKMKHKTGFLLICILVLFSFPVFSQGDLTFDKYHNPGQLEEIIKTLGQHENALVHELAETAGGSKLLLLEIGSEVGKEKTLPAVIAAANMEGTVPLASEAALYLASRLLDNPEMYKDKTWYIIPCGNPDALSRFFSKPLFADARNAAPYNDDMDEAVDEDGVEDLNSDGIISMMRVRDPEGEWIQVPEEPRLMRKADPSKGESGQYSLYCEGLDNDLDGLYNEDGPGGTNVGINFPHGFHYWTADGGTWAGSSREARAVLEFIYAHPEIALSVTYGSSNFCLSPPRSDRKGGNDMSRLRISERYGRMFGLDTKRTYTYDEAKEALHDALPEGMELTDERLAGILGLGAEVNPMTKDMAFYKEISTEYNKFLKEKGLLADRITPENDKDGSFELLAYYHLGIPSFALDFWTPPAEKTEPKPDGDNDKPEKTGKPGKKDSGDKDDPGTADGKTFLKYSDTQLNGQGFLEWTTFNHPTLGEIEIGGQVPFAANTPPPADISSLLANQVPWTFELASMLPRISLGDIKVETLGSGLYRIEAIIENQGRLPYPIAMGSRNGRILPVIIVLDNPGITILEGKTRTKVSSVPGKGAAKAAWLIKADNPLKITLKALTMNAWTDEKEISVGGAK